MTLETLRVWIGEKMAQHPSLRSEIRDLYRLCLDEIEEGASQTNEIYLCMESVNELINDKQN